MPNHCVAIGCKSGYTSQPKKEGVTFHRFPRCQKLRKIWIDALQRKDFTPSKTSCLCSLHFTQSDLTLESSDKRQRSGPYLQKKRLKANAVPSVFLQHSYICSPSGLIDSDKSPPSMTASDDEIEFVAAVNIPKRPNNVISISNKPPLRPAVHSSQALHRPNVSVQPVLLNSVNSQPRAINGIPLTSPRFAQSRPSMVETPVVLRKLNEAEIVDLVIKKKYDIFYATLPSKKPTRRGVHVFSCTFQDSCQNLRFSSNITFMNHIDQHFWRSPEVKCDVNNTCKECFMRFGDLISLKTHTNCYHRCKDSRSKCKICDYTFWEHQSYLMHMFNRHGIHEMPYMCRACGYQTSIYSSLICHFKTEHENTSYFLCRFCLDVSVTAPHFINHIKLHFHRKENVKCSYCRLIFVRSSLLMKMHIELQHRSCSTISLEKFNLYIRNHYLPKPTLSQTLVPKQHVSNISSSLKPSSIDLLLSLSNTQSCGIQISEKHSSIVNIRNKSAKHRAGLLDRCIECGSYVFNLALHFNQEFRCSKCSYVTHCARSACFHLCKAHFYADIINFDNIASMAEINRALPGDCTCKCMYSTNIGSQMIRHLTYCKFSDCTYYENSTENTSDGKHKSAAIRLCNSSMPLIAQTVVGRKYIKSSVARKHVTRLNSAKSITFNRASVIEHFPQTPRYQDAGDCCDIQVPTKVNSDFVTVIPLAAPANLSVEYTEEEKAFAFSNNFDNKTKSVEEPISPVKSLFDVLQDTLSDDDENDVNDDNEKVTEMSSSPKFKMLKRPVEIETKTIPMKKPKRLLAKIDSLLLQKSIKDSVNNSQFVSESSNISEELVSSTKSSSAEMPQVENFEIKATNGVKNSSSQVTSSHTVVEENILNNPLSEDRTDYEENGYGNDALNKDISRTRKSTTSSLSHPSSNTSSETNHSSIVRTCSDQVSSSDVSTCINFESDISTNHEQIFENLPSVLEKRQNSSSLSEEADALLQTDISITSLPKSLKSNLNTAVNNSTLTQVVEEFEKLTSSKDHSIFNAAGQNSDNCNSQHNNESLKCTNKNSLSSECMNPSSVHCSETTSSYHSRNDEIVFCGTNVHLTAAKASSNLALNKNAANLLAENSCVKTSHLMNLNNEDSCTTNNSGFNISCEHNSSKNLANISENIDSVPSPMFSEEPSDNSLKPEKDYIEFIID